MGRNRMGAWAFPGGDNKVLLFPFLLSLLLLVLWSSFLRCRQLSLLMLMSILWRAQAMTMVIVV